ncbi:hypothetical protein G3T36_08185 [Diaminobutyricibacter tongyongensis]|uniref:Uncharacterized protein n=1 Tax=Leifsonia tongyongensis TaxID=1268043 RepID=A0A6L9XWN7_9MICO|nr:hypothetical protein [Diaminobutyricibacter tongyongensis]NEN05850.1 hypothetical protein [Diaminobutyricibacter tongyongensis]
MNWAVVLATTLSALLPVASVALVGRAAQLTLAARTARNKKAMLPSISQVTFALEHAITEAAAARERLGAEESVSLGELDVRELRTYVAQIELTDRLETDAQKLSLLLEKYSSLEGPDELAALIRESDGISAQIRELGSSDRA